MMHPPSDSSRPGRFLPGLIPLLLALSAALCLCAHAADPEPNAFGMVEGATAADQDSPEELQASFADAVERDRAALVRQLLSRGVSPNLLVEDGEPALVRAIRLDNRAVVRVLLGSDGLDINAVSRLGENALMLAVYAGNRGLVMKLLSMGAEVNRPDGWTPVHYAAAAGHVDLLRLLIERGGAVNVQTRAGITPLYMAARLPSREAVTELLKNGAFRDLCNDKGESPADAARRAGDEELAEYLKVERCVSPAAEAYRQPLPSVAPAAK